LRSYPTDFDLLDLGKRVDGECDSVADANLPHEPSDVCLHGAFVDAERKGDLAVRLTRSKQVEDLPFAWSKAGKVSGTFGSVPLVVQ